MKTLVVDFDDISLDNPDANGLQYVFYLKGKYPKFKVTFFLIPGRSTIPWIQELRKISWIRLAMHGFNHDEEEEITQSMLNIMEPYTNLYKGPNWKINDNELVLLQLNNWKIAVQETLKNVGVKQWPLTDKRSFHGHCWIKADWERLEKVITADTEFKFIEEVI